MTDVLARSPESPGRPTITSPAKAGRIAVTDMRWTGSAAEDRGTLAVLALVTLLALGLRLWHVGHQPLWLDEAFSVWLARHPLDRLLAPLIRIDKHPPLYYALLHVWMSAFGEGDTAVRSLSALTGTLCVPAVYFLGREVDGRTTGLLSALLVAVAPGHVGYSREARMYPLATVLAIVSLTFFLRLLHRPSGESLQWNRARMRAACGYVLSTGLALWTHNAMAFLPAAQTAAVVALGLLGGRNRDPEWTAPPLGSWLILQACVLIVWAPWFPAMLRQATALSQSFWLTFPTGGRFEEAFLGVGGRDPETRALRRLVYYVPYFWGIWCWRRSLGRLVPLLFAIYVPVLAEYAISYYRPVFLGRTLLWITVPLLVIAAHGLRSVPQPRSTAGSPVVLGVGLAVLVVLGANVTSLALLYAGPPEESWLWTAHLLAQKARTDDLVLIDGAWSRLSFDRYRPAGSAPFVAMALPWGPSDTTQWDGQVRTGDIPRLASALDNRPRAWLIRRARGEIVDPDSLVSTYLEHVFPDRCRLELPGLSVELYSRPSPESPAWCPHVSSEKAGPFTVLHLRG